MKAFIIDNIADKKESENLRKIINKNYPDIKIKKSTEITKLPKILSKIVSEKPKLIICAGGDGTINNVINNIIKIDLQLIRKINFAVIPYGTANDLANQLNINNNAEIAMKQILNGKVRKIDLIKVNNHYYITGGGIGLPAQIVEDSNKFSSTFLGKLIKRNMKDFIYFISTLKKFLFGYKRLRLINSEELNNLDLLAVYVLNQPFIGRRFNLAPEAKNNDGYMDIKFVKVPPTFLSHFLTLSKGTKGELDNLKWVIKKKKNKITIKFKEPTYFMGDGELLEKSDQFKMVVIPKSINFIC
ncbi:MAG: hypothetical protein ISS01_00390 [Nanoarchaeota archaeon]|nr:hypothetical protein [Nanoarchaeota archaeon]